MSASRSESETRVTAIDVQGVVYDLSDMSGPELRYLLAEPCTCTRGHVTGDGIDSYTCFAHRAQAELDHRAALSPFPPTPEVTTCRGCGNRSVVPHGGGFQCRDCGLPAPTALSSSGPEDGQSDTVPMKRPVMEGVDPEAVSPGHVGASSTYDEAEIPERGTPFRLASIPPTPEQEGK